MNTLSTKVYHPRSRRQKAIALGLGKRSVSLKRKSASPERKAGEKSPSKTAAIRGESAKKDAKARKSVSFELGNDDDLPKSDVFETPKGTKSSERIKIPRKKTVLSDTLSTKVCL